MNKIIKLPHKRKHNKKILNKKQRWKIIRDACEMNP